MNTTPTVTPAVNAATLFKVVGRFTTLVGGYLKLHRKSEVARVYNGHILSSAFSTWRHQAKVAVGVKSLVAKKTTSLLTTCFGNWRHQAKVAVDVKSLVAKKTTSLLATCFGNWRHQANIAVGVKSLIKKRTTLVLTTCFGNWSYQTEFAKGVKGSLLATCQDAANGIGSKRPREESPAVDESYTSPKKPAPLRLPASVTSGYFAPPAPVREAGVLPMVHLPQEVAQTPVMPPRVFAVPVTEAAPVVAPTTPAADADDM
jgi:hypothetical protein